MTKTETFLRATPLIPQYRRYPGFQKEAVRVTPENVQLFRGGVTVFNHKCFLLTLSLPYGKPISSGDLGKRRRRNREKRRRIRKGTVC